MKNLGSISDPKSLVTKEYVDGMAEYPFSVTLPAASWSNHTLTVSNAGFIATGYAYLVSPSAPYFDEWCYARIYASDVTTNGSMTFTCTNTPSGDITAYILRKVVPSA